MKHQTGVYSGTFDPIHSGHIAFAEEAMRVCRLDEVIFLPEQRPRGKNKTTDILHRIALIEHATVTNTKMSAKRLTSEQFTIQKTLPELRQAFSNSHLTFLVGSDVARTFLHSWDDLAILLKEVSFAIGLRSGDTPAIIQTLMSQVERTHNIAADYALISTPEADMTSSQIRNGTADMSRLHPDILNYIQEHRLYQDQATML